jgi:hypothetical protein
MQIVGRNTLKIFWENLRWNNVYKQQKCGTDVPQLIFVSFICRHSPISLQKHLGIYIFSILHCTYTHVFAETGNEK